MKVEYRHDRVYVRMPDGAGTLTMKMMRTIRVPDLEDVSTSRLPPDLGTHFLYKVREHSSTLPASIVERGGCIVPMYRKST